MIKRFIAQMSQVATTATSFLLRNHKTVGLLAIIALLIVIPIPAEANVNFNCQFNFFPDGKPNTFDLGCKIGEIWLGLMSIFAFICGNILDLVVKFFVFEMSTSLETGTIFGFVPTLNGEAQIPVYRQMWFIVRDLANLGFIFILIYAAIATIFKIKGVDYRRVIPQLVLVAILMNFSLFFVQVAVDVSNYVSYQFFTNVNIEVVENDGVTPVKDREGNPISGKLAAGNQQGLSNVIMNVTRVTALVSSPADLESSGVANGTLNNNQPGFAYGFFAGVFVLIAALTMLAGAMLLFIRFFMILIYMIASPIAFASYILEGTKKSFFQNWWMKGLSAQLVFAPAYFGMLYLSLKFLSTLSSGSGLQFGDGVSAAGYWVKTAFLFMISAAFLIYSLIAAKELGAVGGKGALGFVKRTTAATMLGGGALLARNTIGRAGNRYVNSNQDRLRQRMYEGGLRGKIAGLQLKSGRKVSNASFDSRLALDRIPGVKMSEISYGNRSDLEKKSYVAQKEKKEDDKYKTAMDVGESLSPEQRKRYAKRLKSEKDGLRGLFQFATHAEADDGALVLRDWANNWHDGWVEKTRSAGDWTEGKLTSGEPGTIRRKAAAATNRLKNFAVRNDILLGGGTDDLEAIKIQEQVNAEERRKVKRDVSANKDQIDSENETIFIKTALSQDYKKEIKELQEGVSKALENGDEAGAERLRNRIRTVQDEITNVESEASQARSNIKSLKESNEEIRIKGDEKIRGNRNVQTIKRSIARLDGGFAETKAAEAIKNYETEAAKVKSEKSNEKMMSIMEAMLTRANYNAPEARRAMDATDSTGA